MAIRKRTGSYWEKRSLERLTVAERDSQRHIRQVFDIYDDARRRTVMSVQGMYAAYYKQNSWDMAALKTIAPAGDIQRFLDDMRKAGLETALPANYQGRMTRLGLINAQIWGETRKLAIQHGKIETNAHVETINKSFNRTIYDVAKGIGSTPEFNRLNTATVGRLLNAKFAGKNYSERIWGNTDILANELRGTLSAAIATGQTPDKTVREIQERFGVGKYSAQRLVQTETNFFENSTEIEAYKEMGIKKYVFMATLDGRTSQICQEHDGKIYTVAEARMGSNVPPLLPNCRSTIRPYIGKDYEPATRIARDPRTGRNQYVTNMSYADWSQQFGIGDFVQPGRMPMVMPPGMNEVQYRLGDEHYRAMSGMADSAPSEEREAWSVYRGKLGVDNPLYTGKRSAHYNPRTGGVTLNIRKVAKGTGHSRPYETAFHEFFHNIDHLAGTKSVGSYFSSSFENGLFTKTLKREAESLIESYGRNSDGVKMTRRQAAKRLEAEIKKIPVKDRAAISDILHGATNRLVDADIGHYTPGYWNRSGQIAKETFANMAGASLANPKALAAIKKYMPESYKIYRKMLGEITKGV